MANKLQTQVFGKGPDLVLLHGWGLNSGVWSQQLDGLQQHFRIHLVDLPGYGLNYQVLPTIYDIDTVAAMVAEVVPAKARLLGWSLGGLIAQQIAARQLVNLSKLVLVASTPCFVAKPPAWPGIQAEVLEAFKAQLGANLQKTIERFVAIQAMGSPSMRRDIKMLQTAIQAKPMPAAMALMEGLNILAETDIRNLIRSASLPVLHIFGGKDGLVPVSIVENIRSVSKQLQIEVMGQAAHAPFISHPAYFSKILIKNI